MVSSSPSSVCPRCGQSVSGGWLGGLCPRCVSRTSLRSLLGGTPTARPRLGDYELGEELGRGAMGAVYRARHVTLGQTVALKVVLTGEFAGEAERRRFLAEAGQAARLDHPNIVRVLNYGEAEGRQFYAMELIEGPTLAAARQTAELKTPDAADRVHDFSLRQIASLISQVARAVQHAHERGVLHRDLKPGNILLDGKGIPHISDFGLATLLGGDGASLSTGQTLAGSPLGTPAYMAPEQVRGDRGVTTASDLWSLGAILYELLAGRPPFVAGSALETYRKILEEEPPKITPVAGRAPRGTTPSASRDLEIIARKCLRKTPSERYASAGAFADDLDRWLNAEPIRARPVSGPELIWLWARRRPVVAGLTAAVALLILLVAVGGPIVALRLARAERQERAANVTAQDQLFESLLAQARASRLTLEPGRREAGLTAIRGAARIRVTPELRNEAVALLALSDQGQPAGLTNHIYRGDGLRMDGRFERFLRVEPDQATSVRRLADWQEEFRWPAQTNSGFVAYRGLHAHGSVLVLNYNRPRLLLVNVTNRQVIHDAADTWFGGFSPDERLFAGLRDNRLFSIHDTATGRTVVQRRFEGTARADAAFHPGGRTILAVPVDNQLQLWNWATDQIVETFGEEGGVRCAVWSGDLLAYSLEDGQVRLFDLRTRRRQSLGGHFATVDYLRFSPDGAWVSSVFGYDGLTHWWDTRTGSPLVRNDRFRFEQFSDDGTKVLLSTPTHWAIAPVIQPHSYRITRNVSGSITGFSPDGGWAVGGGPDGLTIWDVARGAPLLTQPTDGLHEAHFLPGGKELIACDRSRIVRWELATDGTRLRLAKERTLFKAPGWPIDAAAVSPDGSRYALTHGDRLTLVDLRTPGPTTDLGNGSVPRTPTFSRDNRRLATGTFHGSGLQIWDLEKAAPEKLLNTGNVDPQFSPDGSRLLAATSAGLIVFETGTWKPLFKLPSEAASNLPGKAAWSPNGRLLAYVHRQKTVLLLDADSWQTVLKLESPSPQRLERCLFDPAGDRLVVSSNGRTEWWDLRGLRAELEELGIPWNVPPGGITPAAQPPEFANLLLAPAVPALPAGIRPLLEFPPRATEATAGQIDLGGRYNARLDEDWHLTGNPANSLATFPAGLVELDGTRFDVRGIIQLASASLGTRRTGYPLTVTNLPVRQTCHALHFLGACGYAGSEPDGTPGGSYVVRYADGLTAEIPIRIGRESDDWWRTAGKPFAGASTKVAWTGIAPNGHEVQLFKQTWSNPRPEVAVESVGFVSAGRAPAPFLLALTAD